MVFLQPYTATVNLSVIIKQSILLPDFYKFLVSECEIDPFLPNAPLIINSLDKSVVYPKRNQKTILLNEGDQINFACPQSEVHYKGAEITKSGAKDLVAAKCKNNIFKVKKDSFEWKHITCKLKPKAAVDLSNRPCATNARYANIGYLLSDRTFIQIIEICFDTKQEITLFSKHKVPACINSRDKSTLRPTYWQTDSGFFTKRYNFHELYKKINEMQTIKGLLGINDNDSKFMDNSSLYLARGHLASRCDFVYGPFQDATFRYINTAPQWQSFNGGNWLKIENDIRKYAHNKEVDLDVWTGTYEVTKLPHMITGQDIMLSLYSNKGKQDVFIPAIFWKVVYCRTNGHGIVIIGVNNPYEKNTQRYKYCTDISSQINWINWKKENLMGGYSYACQINDFKNTVKYIPDLNVYGILN